MSISPKDLRLFADLPSVLITTAEYDFSEINMELCDLIVSELLMLAEDTWQFDLLFHTLKGSH